MIINEMAGQRKQQQWVYDGRGAGAADSHVMPNSPGDDC